MNGPRGKYELPSRRARSVVDLLQEFEMPEKVVTPSSSHVLYLLLLVLVMVHHTNIAVTRFAVGYKARRQ